MILPVVLLSLGLSAGFASAADPGVGDDIAVTEAVSFTKRVATIDDCVFDTATISWGDGTSTSGQFDTGATPGVKGTHTYSNEGTYLGTVTYNTDCTSNGQVGFTATVADAALSAEGRDILADVGQPLTTVVSHFTDLNPNEPASDFSAQIAWGDGSHSAGTVSAVSGGGFDVTGTHTYQSAGQAAVNVTITSVGGSSASSSSTAQIFLEPLTASFTYSPTAPCPFTPGPPARRGASLVTFDATGSGPGISSYQWQLLGTDQDAGKRYDDAGVNGKVVYRRWFEYISVRESPEKLLLLRPPVVASLSITDSFGRTVSAPSQTVTFQEPEVVGAVHTYIYYLVYGIWGTYTVATPESPTSCWRPRTWFDLLRARLTTRAAILKRESTVAATVVCNQSTECGGTLNVVRFGKPSRALATVSDRGTRRKVRALGNTPFLLPAGESRRVEIPLNKGGRQLLRQHRWNSVTLASIGGARGGKPQIRTVRLRPPPPPSRARG